MKRFYFPAMAILLLILAACSRVPRASGSETKTSESGKTQTQTAATEPSILTSTLPATDEPTPPETNVPKEDVLDGSWELLVCGEIERGQFAAATIRFDAKNGTFTFEKDKNESSDGNVIKGQYRLGQISNNSNGKDLVVLTPTSASYGYGSGDAIGVPVEFEFIHVACGDSEVLALRELAFNWITNGDSSPYTFSALGMENFGYSYCAYDDFWVFVRSNPSVEALSDSVNDMLRNKNRDFYAYRWLAYDDVVYLQDMAWTDVTVDGFSLIDYTYAEIGRAPTAVWYKTADHITAQQTDIRVYQPQFVHVRTDQNGLVYEITEVQRANKNDYFPVINGTGSEYRDPARFGQADADFIGTWKCPDDPSAFLTVQAASLQVGGYELIFRFGPSLQASCNANLSGNDLQVNQGSFTAGQNFVGKLSRTDDGVTFVVEESEVSQIPAGARIDFERP